MRSNVIGSLICALVLILLAVLTGDSDAVDPANVQENAALPAGDLAAAHTVGQTFLSRYPRLHAIQVRWIRSDGVLFSRPAYITLHLCRAGGSTDLVTVSLSMDEVQNDRFTKFVFSPLPDSQDQSYYFWLALSDAPSTRGFLSLWSSATDDYPDGSLRVDDVPTTRDLAFRVYYEPDPPMLVHALWRMVSQWNWGLLMALLLFLVPGAALFIAFGEPATRHVVEFLAWAGGLSLAILSASAVVFLGLEIPLIGIVVVVVVIFVFQAGQVVRLRKTKHLTESRRDPSSHASLSGRYQRRVLLTTLPEDWALWALGALAVFSLAIGLAQIRDIPAPLWVDSLTHAEHIRTLIEQNRLPSGGFYHLGYHVVVALVVQITGISIPQAMLLTGQLLLTQVGLSIFLLSRRCMGSDIAALTSAIIVWFLSPTPLYFVTWGRYPLVMGAAILPVAILCAIDLIDQPRFNGRAFCLAAVTLSGLGFTHIRLVAFYVLFVVVYLAERLIRTRTVIRWQEFYRIGLVAATGMLLGVIWLVALAARGVDWQVILTQNAAAPEIDLDTTIAVLLTQHGPMVWLLTLIGGIVGIIRRARATLTILAWYVGLLAVSVFPLSKDWLPTSLIGLTGFLPAALIVGDLAGWLQTKTAVCNRATAAIWITMLSVVTLAGARDMVSFINPATILFSDVDVTAMEWIKTHTPAEARFLINSTVWFDTNYVPSDGGGWIPYTTGRTVEQLDSPAAASANDAEALAQWLAVHKIEYVYLGRRAGVLSKSVFVAQPTRYARVYNQDGIAIFARQMGSQ